MPTLTDLSTIRDLCARYDFALSKGFGQNFIINPGICPRIAEASGIGPGWGALEVGPGIGVLTEQLCKRADNVVSIEVDKRLPPLLEETMADYDNFKLILNDVLKVDLKALLAEEFGGKPVAVCANLPYYITTPAITALMESGAFEHITVMVQKEVAERICAAPGTSAYSAFSIYVQYHAKAEILFDVPADCFVPRPKVDSAVLKLTPLAQPAVETRDEKLFFALVRAAFNMRRKTLVNALGPVLASAMSKEEIVSLVEAAGLDARIRGERLSLADYAKLADLASEKLNKG